MDDISYNSQHQQTEKAGHDHNFAIPHSFFLYIILLLLPDLQFFVFLSEHSVFLPVIVCNKVPV